MDLPRTDGVRFGGFVLDGGRRQLLGTGAEVHVSPKAFHLLTLLVRNYPDALSKPALIEHLWPDTFVSEVNLPALVTELRTALRDTARNSRYIRTVYGFGYAFCAAVHPLTDRSASSIGLGAAFFLWNRRKFELTEAATVLGRSPKAGIRLGSAGVSRYHARVVLEGTSAVLEDLGSKNGTYVGATRITAPRALFDRDQVRLGPILLTFRIAPPTGSTETQMERNR